MGLHDAVCPSISAYQVPVDIGADVVSSATGRRGRWVLLALAFVTSACTAEADVAAPVATIEASPVVPTPSSLSARLESGAADVHWSTPIDLFEPLAGYDFYFDDAAPVRLPPNVTSRNVTGLKAGQQHLFQVVALTASGRSRPVETLVKVPYAESGEGAVSVAPAADQPEASGASQATPVQAPAAKQAPPSAAAGAASASAASPGRLKVQGVVSWLTFGTSRCEGWRSTDDLVHVLDNSGAILAVATVVTKTTQPKDRSAVCEYHYAAEVPAEDFPVFTFLLNTDADLSDIGRIDKKTVPAASIAGGKGPDLRVTDAY